MSKHTIRLVEQTIVRHSAEFILDASSPGHAAAEVSAAYETARDNGLEFIRLSDGRGTMLEQLDPVQISVSYLLVDDDRQTATTIDPDEIRRALT